MNNRSPAVSDDRPLNRSKDLLERASRVIPEGSQTGSKSPTQFVQGVAPSHLERGKGSHVWDVDGNEYIDYGMALGPILLGHDYPRVTRAVEDQLQDGTMFTMPHRLQVEVAELFTEVVPCAEMVRFAKNGNDVTALAAKLARAYTGRDVIATQGYHGWPDVWMSGNSNLARGIPDAVGEYTEQFEYNDVESLERIFEAHPDDVAAIVTTAVNLEEPEDGFIEEMRELADREGAVLIFDEILTGFRFSLGGAQEYFDVEPDLACFAKGMANGFPISALAGDREIMQVIGDDDFFFSMTYAGEAASLAATKAAIAVQREEPVHEHIADRGQKLRDGYNELASEFGLEQVTRCHGYPQRSKVSFTGEGDEPDHVAKSLFMQECMKRGVLFSGIHLPSYSHTDDDVARTLDVYHESMAELADAIDKGDVTDRVEGKPVGATLRERTGEN